MTKEEIKDFVDVSNKEDIINFIFKIITENTQYEKAIILSREMLKNSVSKERYNDLVKKYNKLVKKGK